MNDNQITTDAPKDANDFRDQLPSDLNAAEHVGVYKFPDNSRRRIPGYIYLGGGVLVIALATIIGSDGPYVNTGLLAGGVVLALLVCSASHQVGE